MGVRTEELRAALDQSRILVELSPTAIAMFDRDLDYLAMSRRWIETHGEGRHGLVENALKYSAQAPGPLVEIGGEARDGRFRLRGRDNGIGFDMEYHDRIFELFRRLHTHAEYAGSGVGLALAKRAMEHMEGKVWAESEPGQGATFYLEFQLVAQVADLVQIPV